jgi:predicted secreted protein
MIQVGETLGLPLPERTKETIDATHQNSDGGWREFIGGLKDGGEMTIDVNYVPGDTGQAAMRAAFAYDGAVYLLMTCPTVPPTQLNFRAIAIGDSGDMPFDDKMTGTFTLKVTGPPILSDVA